MNIEELQKAVYAQALSKGLYKGCPGFTKLLWHIREEAGEAIRAWKEYRDLDVHYECPGASRYCIDRDFNCPTCPRRHNEGVTMELADVIIMTLSVCEYMGIDIEDAIQEKMAYNAIRKR